MCHMSLWDPRGGKLLPRRRVGQVMRATRHPNSTCQPATFIYATNEALCLAGRTLSRCSVECVCLLEQPHVLCDVVATFFEGFGVPFASLSAEEVTSIDVDSPG